jgi:3-oxoacyl-[acyl-carrier protein] reductase
VSGRIAVITGSSRGIGAAVARAFAAEGDAVVVHGRDDEAIEAVRAGIERDGGRAIGVAADLTDLAAVEALRKRTEDELGPVDVLVANAGGSTTPPGDVEAMSEEQWRTAVDTNLTATFLTLKSFLPGMKERGRGAIVTVSSAAARRAHIRNPAGYAAAKAGIEQLTKIVALQAGPFGVRVNCIAPETIMTERNEAQIPKDYLPSMIDAHPIRRLGTPDDIARAALFLASDDSAWITGVVLDVAGGAVMV